MQIFKLQNLTRG